ncbi:MAG: coagulation factor 5/8 type domain protein [Bacteroidota bacterium]|nr:coagulation factor 5/8 type domain protein [Bacteroidota bacterium]
MMRTVYVLLLLIALVGLTGCKKYSINSKHTGELYLDHATDIAVALQGIQKSGTHLWQKAGWWNAANIMEALIDYSKLSGNAVSGSCRQIFNANKGALDGGFKNRSYDDCAWWALAWIKAYDQYGDKEYLEIAEDIFAYMKAGGWDNNCNGGMAWQNTVRYKNAITNELFILLAARLAVRQSETYQKAYYLEWALRGWNWLDASGMLNADNLYNDGLDKNCNNNGEQTWTYNQGVILAALKEIYGLTADPQYLQRARPIAFACMTKLSDPDSILTEPCGRNFGEDAGQFKGIYIKFLSELNTVLKDPQIKQYIIHNATTAWANAQNNQHLFDGLWQGSYLNWQGSTTGAALDLMNAATVQQRQ